MMSVTPMKFLQPIKSTSAFYVAPHHSNWSLSTVMMKLPTAEEYKENFYHNKKSF